MTITISHKHLTIDGHDIAPVTPFFSRRRDTARPRPLLFLSLSTRNIAQEGQNHAQEARTRPAGQSYPSRPLRGRQRLPEARRAARRVVAGLAGCRGDRPGCGRRGRRGSQVGGRPTVPGCVEGAPFAVGRAAAEGVEA